MANEHNIQKVVIASKSMAVAIITTILFGPLGMLYSAVATNSYNKKVLAGSSLIQ